VGSSGAGEANLFRNLTPAEITEVISKQRREGVSVSVASFEDSRKHRVTAIHWRPGDPNALAEMIIRNVGDEEVSLILDGNAYVVRKVS